MGKTRTYRTGWGLLGNTQSTETENGEFIYKLCSWMILVVDFFQSRLIDVCVYLRCRNARMAKHLLDLPKVCAAGQ